MLKQNTCSTIIVVLKRLRLPFEGVHKVCRKLYVISGQKIVYDKCRTFRNNTVTKGEKRKKGGQQNINLSIVLFSDFKIMDLFVILTKSSKCVIQIPRIYYRHISFCYVHINWTQINISSTQLKFSLASDFVSFFLIFWSVKLNETLRCRYLKFIYSKRGKMHKTIG